MGLYGPPHAPEEVFVRYHELPIKDLPPALRGLRFAQLTDIHYNDNNSHDMGGSDKLLEQAVEAINNASVDLVFLTGDYVDHWPEAAPALADRYLSKIKSRYGVYASLGNHDHQKSHSQQLVVSSFRKVGIHVLVNEAAHPIPSNKNFQVIGIGDKWHRWQYQPHKAMSHVPKHSHTSKTKEKRAHPVTIVLSHNPDTAEDLSIYQSDLILAGHTHGGHHCFPFPFNHLIPHLARLPPQWRQYIPHEQFMDVVQNWQWSYGFSDIAPHHNTPHQQQHSATTTPTTKLYTSSGLARLPPRYLCQAEVVVFTLVNEE